MKKRKKEDKNDDDKEKKKKLKQQKQNASFVGRSCSTPKPVWELLLVCQL